MRPLFNALVGAALAGAVVVPDIRPAPLDKSQVPLSGFAPTDLEGQKAPGPDPSDTNNAYWVDSLPPKTVSALRQAAGRLAKAVNSAVGAVQDTRHQLSNELADALAGVRGDDDEEPSRGTIYQLIRACEHTSHFADAVDEHPDIVKILNCTEARNTLFVPTNKAFRHIPGHHEGGGDGDHDGEQDKSHSRKFIEHVLRYHVGLGEYPAGRILHTNTLPTALNEDLMGGEPQRLRTSIGLGGVKINFYSKVVAANIEASNGIIHAVDHVLIPPFMVGRLLTLFPDRFSTLLLAYEKTDFVREIHGVHMIGSTVFAPSNAAFSRLGGRVNAFLFNTETGHKYLRALLRYHISPNATLYTDAYYDAKDDSTGTYGGLTREHYDLPTLLGEARVAVDIARLAGFAAVRVNGFAHVSVRDGIAKNGVIQVLDQVLIPPCRHHAGDEAARLDVDIEELKKRLEPYM